MEWIKTKDGLTRINLDHVSHIHEVTKGHRSDRIHADLWIEVEFVSGKSITLLDNHASAFLALVDEHYETRQAE